MPSSPFVVRLPGSSVATAAFSPTKLSPNQQFVMDNVDFPSVSADGPVVPNLSNTRHGAWATRPILPPPDASALDLHSPIERTNARSPVSPSSSSPSPPPAHHLIAPSPTPSDQDADELAADIDMMDIGPVSPVDIVRPVPLRADAQPYGVDTDELQGLAYYRAAAEHWHRMCVQMQTHVAMVCGPLPGPPPF